VRNFGQSTFARRESLRFREGGVFFKQAGQYSSHQTEGEFEQTNVEILCVCTILNRHRRGEVVVFRSVLKRTTLERLEKMHSNRQVTEHWKDIGAAERGGKPGGTLAETAREG
jgi:hypothetical protein